MRADGRDRDQLRPVGILPGFVETADGSALISVGRTRVICTASVEESVPAWMRGRGRGWVTAEYAMLPASTGERKARDIAAGKPDGRTTEIQRLIGRSLRAVVDMEALGERTVWLDCDVLQADGGTRCAASAAPGWRCAGARRGWCSGGDRGAAAQRLDRRGERRAWSTARPLLDLAYVEDSRAESDMNVVMTGAGRLVEVQAPRRAARSRAPSSTACSTSPRAGIARPDGGPGGGGRRRREPEVVLATGNRDKVAELGAMLPAPTLGAAPEGFDVEETGITLLQNAWIKAAALRGEIADDASWWPTTGPRRPRPRGPPRRVQRPLRRAPTPPTPTTAAASSTSWRAWRTASAAFVCVLVGLDAHGGDARRVRHRARHDRAGDARGEGFGYDPVFVPEGGERSMAEMTRDEKAAISHRGRAARPAWPPCSGLRPRRAKVPAMAERA